MRAELEALLATSWTRETFATYADALQSAGDPRGEWIALDLDMLRNGVTPAIQQRRDKLLAKYKLGTFYGASFTYGFVDELFVHPGLLSNRKRILDVTLSALAGPLGGYVRRLWLRDTPARLTTILEALATAPRPWLYHLELDPGDDFRPPAIPNAVIRRVVEQSPRLETIALGHGAAVAVFGNVERPGLTIGPAVAATKIWAHGPAFIRFTIPSLGYEDLELSRLQRLHGGTVDEMSDPAREAWAELRWRIDCARCDPRARARQPFPVPLLARIVREIDTSSYYGADWAPLERKLDRASEVLVEF